MIIETIPGPPPSTADLPRRPLLFNLTGRAEIAVSGRDRGDFLHGLVTNDVKRLRPGEGCAAAFLTPKGRMLADLAVLCAPEELVVDAEPDLARALDALLRKYIFFQQVAVENRTGVTGVLHVEGTGAGEILGKVIGQVGPSEPHSSLLASGARVVRESRGVRAFDHGTPPTLDEWLKPGCSSKKSMGKRPVPSAKRSSGVVFQAREGSDMASLPVPQAEAS